MRTLLFAAAVVVFAISACGRPESAGNAMEDTTAAATVDTITAPQTIEASHILIAYAGAMRADPAITRTSDEARQLAVDLLSQIQTGTITFEDAAVEYSDCPSASTEAPSASSAGAPWFPSSRMRPSPSGSEMSPES